MCDSFRTSLTSSGSRFSQSFKRKPGKADNERSTGDENERVNKRLRTVENSEDRAEDRRNPEARQESDLYEHVKQGEADYDTQTYGEEPWYPR